MSNTMNIIKDILYFLLWWSLKNQFEQVLKSLKKVLNCISKYLQEPCVTLLSKKLCSELAI